MALYRPLSVDPRENEVRTTYGKEWMYFDTLKNYIGEYHVYQNGAVYSLPEYDPKRSLPLIPYVSTMDHPNNLSFLRLTGRLYNKFFPPTYYFLQLEPVHYEQGFVFRYVIQKKNEPKKIWEVSSKQYKNVNKNNQPGINADIYNRVRFKWLLKGPREVVVNQNRKTIIDLLPKFPGITDYFNDPAEYLLVKPESEASNLYTPGGQYKTDSGVNYIGLYHMHPILGAMEGAKHINQVHGKLTPI